jgi:hypothetical protein
MNITIFWKGKSTIYDCPFSIAMLNNQWLPKIGIYCYWINIGIYCEPTIIFGIPLESCSIPISMGYLHPSCWVNEYKLYNTSLTNVEPFWNPSDIQTSGIHHWQSIRGCFFQGSLNKGNMPKPETPNNYQVAIKDFNEQFPIYRWCFHENVLL